MRKVKYLIVFLILFPILVNADCTREGDKFRTDGGLLVDPGSGDYNYYCLGIEHCFAKTGHYYDINSNEVTEQEYYQSCGCRKDTTTGQYYDDHGNETSEGNYNRICLNVGKCDIKNGHYYDNNYLEVTEEEYNEACGCRIDTTTGKYYDNTGTEVTEPVYNRVCLNVGQCSIKDGHYYDNDYHEVTEEEFAQACGCRIDTATGKYYDDHGIETTEPTYNRVCLNVGQCEKKGDHYYDNTYSEVTAEEFAQRCGCRIDDQHYYGKDGLETDQYSYEIQCENPHTGTTNVLLVTLLTFGVVGAVVFIIYKRRKIKEL